MAQFNERELHLLDYEEVERKHDDSDLSVYDAIAKAGADRVMHRFIYIKAKCTQQGAQRAVSYLRPPPDPAKNYVVRHDELKTQTVVRIIEEVAGSLLSHEELIRQQLGHVFGPYLRNLSEMIARDPYFMAPHLKGSQQHDKNDERDEEQKLPSPIMSYMQERKAYDNGKVRVLSAHAGVGKTTLARHLVHNLAKQQSTRLVPIFVPIFVEAHHWGHLDLGQINSLWGIIKNSLDVIDPTHACSRRLSGTLFQHALRQGYLSFVFDGFDELCGSDDFDANQVLQDLAKMAHRSEARILVTTRTLFWEAQIHAQPENVLVWNLDSFNTQQARDYFQARFGQYSAETKHAVSLTKHAVSLYESLREEAQPLRDDRFVNLPLCISMIADLVQDSKTESVTIPPRSDESVLPGESVLQRMLRGFCEREMTRFGIVSSADAQLTSFVDRAVESDQLNPVFDLEDLVFAVEGIKEDDLKRFGNHGLLDRVSGSGQYRFRYDFLGPHLRAIAVAGWLTDPTGSTPFGEKHLLRIIRDEADGRGFVLEQLLTLLDPNSVSDIMSRGRELGGAGPVGSFIFHLARELIDHLMLPRDEETRKLFAGLSGVSLENWNGKLSGWEFRGTLESLHLAGVKFQRCKFHDVVFRRCAVDEGTEFSGCFFDDDLRFEGDGEAPVRQWKNVSLATDCKMSGQAHFAWSDVLGGHSASRGAHIADLLRLGLEKFWYGGHIKRRLETAHWNRGVLGRTGHHNSLLDHMLNVELVRMHPHRPLIELTLESFRDLQNYMDNGQLTGRIRDVYERLDRDN